MERLRLSNFELTNQDARFLSASTAATGQKTILLANASGFVANSFIVLALTEVAVDLFRLLQ